MAARTSKRSRERQVAYKIPNDLSSVDLLYVEEKQKKKNFKQISWNFLRQRGRKADFSREKINLFKVYFIPPQYKILR